jgi:hypothetical protein
VKAGPFQRGRTPWRAEAQESHALAVGLIRRLWVADSRVEQNPEGEGAPGASPSTRSDSAASAGGLGRAGRSAGSLKRQEGRGAGDGVRLHERSKALKGATP